MIARTVFPSLLAVLLSVSSTFASDTAAASQQRNLQGINLCAAYDIVVPLIKDGEENCECDGRTIVCDFDSVCNDDGTSCAELDMKIDFTEEGGEFITYTADYASTFEPVVLVLDVSPDVSEIQSCQATYGGAGCDCTVCNDGQGIDASCESIQAGATTQGCSPIDVDNFEAYIPFLGSDTTIVAGLERSESEAGSDSGAVTMARTTVAAAALASFAVAVAL